jgi:hypothetical protein
MTTITLPPDLERTLTEAASRQGTTAEFLAIDTLRKEFTPRGEQAEGGNLFEFLSGFIGTIEGPAEAYSEDGGRRLADGLKEKQRQGRL